MTSLKRLTAIAVAAASIAAAGTAPATASDTSISIDTCLSNPTLPGCVDYAFEAVRSEIAYGRNTWNYTVAPALDRTACEVYETLTGEQCPSEKMVPRL